MDELFYTTSTPKSTIAPQPQPSGPSIASDNIAELLTALIALEEERGFFERRALSVPYWHAIRNDVFRETLQALGLVKRAHTRLEELPARHLLRPRPRPLEAPRRRFAAARQWTTNVQRSLWTGLPRADLLVANHPRHLPDGARFVCPYSQPLLDGLANSRVLLEGQFQGHYFHPSADETIRYLDLPLVLAHARFSARELVGGGLGTHERAEVRGLVADLQRTFGAAPPFAAVLRRVRTAVLATLGLRPHYERLLDRVQPKLVLEVIGYRLPHMILAQVARARGIVVAELQHGVLGVNHAAYNFAPGRLPEAFPDYLLLFGSMWRDLVPGMPLPAERTPAVGYAWLEHQRENALQAAKAQRKSSVPRVLFLSQGTVGRALSRVAVALREQLDASRLHIVYRLHPSESVGWQSNYPELAASGIDVEPANTRNLYAAQAEADVQVGVYSTALIEGLAFGLRSFIVELPGHEELAAFTARGLLEPVRDATALAHALSQQHEHRAARVEDVWQPHPTAAFQQFVDSVIARAK